MCSVAVACGSGSDGRLNQNLKKKYCGIKLKRVSREASMPYQTDYGPATSFGRLVSAASPPSFNPQATSILDSPTLTWHLSYDMLRGA